MDRKTAACLVQVEEGRKRKGDEDDDVVVVVSGE
jgi:hypothetical protein